LYSDLRWQPGVTNAYIHTDGSLVILDAQLKDERYFICIATNQFGSDSAQVSLDVKGI